MSEAPRGGVWKGGVHPYQQTRGFGGVSGDPPAGSGQTPAANAFLAYFSVTDRTLLVEIKIRENIITRPEKWHDILH